MLRKRSRPVPSSGTSKNSTANSAPAATAAAADPPQPLPPSPSSPPEKKSIKLLPTSFFFFNSSKLFTNYFFTTNSSSDSTTTPETESPTMNHPIPTSARFDTQKPFFTPPVASSPPVTANTPVFLDNQQTKLNPPKISSATNKKQQKHFWEKSNQEKGIGLIALIDETHNNDNNSYSSTVSKQKTKLVVFGSHLKIQIPPPHLPVGIPSESSPTSALASPGEFGIKTPRSHLYPNAKQSFDHDDELAKDSISMEEIELSEDYTCVISHGPNPRTTRIFGNCILESCCGGRNGGGTGANGFCSRLSNEGGFGWSDKYVPVSPRYVPVSPLVEKERKMKRMEMEMESFLSFCHHCKKKIGEGKDIYMYRGEKAFCSQECRSQGMLFEEVEN